MPGGSCRSVFEIAACTSWAAASMFRDSVNCSVMLVPPKVLEDVMASSPAIVENCFSSGVATAAAIVCGLAPGNPADTEIVGKSTFGRSRSEEHTSELQSRLHLVCRLLLEKKK